MSIINNGLLLASGADAATTYQISRSIRLNSADSAYFSRTPGSAGNRKTWTLSLWIKRTKFADNQAVFAAGDLNGVGASLRFNTSDQLAFAMAGATIMIQTSRVFRDPSAWYHIVLLFDTTQATAANRMRLFVNGTEETAFASATYPTQNTDHSVNSTSAHQIGREDQAGTFGQYFNGYIADVYLLDGTATTPSTFAETDAITGQWVPKTPASISYGTNGFRLTFSDNSGTTSTTLGKDAAGSNNWTPNNFSVASGSGNDSLVDSPTSYGTDTGAGGEVRGNYCVCNPLLAKSNETYSNGNLDVSVGATGPGRIWGTIGVSSGKWYFEYTQTSGTYAQAVGIKSNFVTNDLVNNYLYIGYDGTKLNASGGTSSYGATWGNNDVIGVAFDLDAGTITFYKNGTSQGQAFSGITAATYFPHVMQYTGGSFGFTINFGQRAFAYTAPSGYKALCDTNLTAPTIAKPADQFGILLWTGNTTNGNGSRAISGLNFQPEFVWIKARSASVYGHLLFDAVRGAANSLASESAALEGTPAANGKLDSFDSTGFTVNNGTSNGWYVNTNGESYVGWCWNAASSNSTNTQGSITSTVRANATAGFSIVTYTGTGANATIGHGCGAAPAMIILKNRDDTYGWYVYHTSIGATKYLKLNEIAAQDTSSSVFNDTAPTSTVFSIGTFGAVNGSSQKIVAYCFAPVAGYSAFGSYTGNGSSDGPFVFTGFNPRWLMVKAYANLPFSGTYAYWFIYDSARDLLVNPTDLALAANVQDQEFATYYFDFLSNGFKVRTNAVWVNNSNTSFLWAAFAENPFQYARAR